MAAGSPGVLTGRRKRRAASRSNLKGFRNKTSFPSMRTNSVSPVLVGTGQAARMG